MLAFDINWDLKKDLNQCGTFIGKIVNNKSNDEQNLNINKFIYICMI